jgi:hypothetical protein
MSAASFMITLIRESPYLVRMSFDLLYTYLTLGSRVRRTRKAFEEQLILAGMSRKEARRVSACFEELKNSVTSMLKNEITGVPSRR